MKRRGSFKRRARSAAWGRMKAIDGLLSMLSKFTQCSERGQAPRSCLVLLRLVKIGMNVPVDVDRQPGLRAVEVCDEPPDRMLASDLESELATSNRLPGLRFRRRGRMTEVPGAPEEGGGGEVASDVGHCLVLSIRPHPSPSQRTLERSERAPSGRGSASHLSQRERVG